MLLGMADKRRNYWIKRQNILKSPKIRTIGGEALISVTGETLKTFKEPEKMLPITIIISHCSWIRKKIEYKHCKARA